MKFTTKSAYGIRALGYLLENSENKPVPLSKIAKDLNLSEKYLEQLLRLLKKEDIIMSVRGAFGGYMINPKIDDITISQILRALEGDDFLLNCQEDEINCNVRNCPTKGISMRIQRAILSVIDNYTLRDLKRDIEGNKIDNFDLLEE